MGSNKLRGFSLIEVMVVVVIIAILAAISVPAYGRYAERSRRADGKEMLLRVAAAQERFFTNFNRYAGDVADLGFTAGTSESGYYLVTVDQLEPPARPQTYRLVATPQGIQASDGCEALTLTNSGARDQQGATINNGPCW